MNDWMLLIIGVMLLPYLVVPLLIRRNHYFMLNPKLRPVVLGFLPAAVENYFKEKTREFENYGFFHRIDVVSRDYGPHMRVFLRFLVANERATTALCTAVMPDGEDAPVKNFI